MKDFWLRSSDPVALADWCDGFANVLGPVLAAGYAYACVRSDDDLIVPEIFTTLTPQEGKAILGDWA